MNENVSFYRVTLYGTRKPLVMQFELNLKNMSKLRIMEQKGTKVDLVVEFWDKIYSFDALLEWYPAPYMIPEECNPLMLVPHEAKIKEL
jgi:hypothetical protein